MAKFIIIAHRSAGSIFGSASAPAKENGVVMVFENAEAAHGQARVWNNRASPNVRYSVEAIGDDDDEPAYKPGTGNC
jgi:hypothetical protein